MLTHVNEQNQASMVDVSGKLVSERRATAESCVLLPESLRPYFSGGEILVKKGPVFQTAILAGTMAAKRTAELIPLCHPIAFDSCELSVTLEGLLVRIRCTVKCTGKTGVEMEALTGAAVAALTVYDMCKAVSHEITIRDTKLLAKTGGKRTVLDRPLHGLVLTGGKSARMKRDKALLPYEGKPQALRAFELLSGFCASTFLSARPGQWRGTELEALPTIEDSAPGEGPLAGLVSAMATAPEAYWLVLACDLPKVDASTLATLLQHLDPDAPATCFRNEEGGFPEALCAVYTPKALPLFRAALTEGRLCPVKILGESGGNFLPPAPGGALRNVNTPRDYEEVTRAEA